MLELLLIFWLIYLPAATNLLFRIVKNWNQYERKVDYQRKFNSPTIYFLIATKTCPKIVQSTIDSINDSCRKIGYRKYKVQLVTDTIRHKCNGAETFVVPRRFASPAKFKARALQYMLTVIPSEKEAWIFHLDEESIVTEQTIRAVLEHIEDGGALIAEGPINYPNDIRNMLTLFIEGERSVGCFYCVDQMKDSPVWLHGSNLLVNSVVEHEVGWEFGHSLAEDQRFAYEAEKKFGKIFGWHGGLILEKPAFTIRDVLKQRKRWFYGSLQNLSYLDSKRKSMQYYFLASWLIGFFAALLTPLSWFNVIPTVLPVKVALLFALFMWLTQYQVGLYLNLRHLHLGVLGRVKLHLLQLALCPVVGFISTLPALLAVVKPPKTFEIVDKT